MLSPLRKMHPDIAVVMITAYASTDTAVQALNEGAKAYITKPLRLKKVLGTVERIAGEQRRAKKEKRIMEELLRYAARLEAQNEELGAFAHTVAHDLKAPSYKIAGYAETLLEEEYGPLPQEVQRECLRIMAQGARQMSTLVDELLLLAQVRSDEVELVPLTMGEIIDSVQDRLALMIERHQAELVVPDAWPTALGHGSWVEEVWVNYISNAIKYGGRPEEGVPPRIELGYGPSGQEPPGGGAPCPQLADPAGAPGTPSRSGWHVRFWVRDNGRGLTSEEQERLFTPFTRLAQVGTKGHGLGLSVVRRIVEKLGGEVGVESERGEGSVFSFTLRGLDEASL